MPDHRLEIILAAKDATGKVFQTLGGRMNALKNQVFSLHGAVITLAGGYGLKKLLGGLWDVGVYTERMEKGLTAATGSMEEAQKAEVMLREESERLGLVFEDQIKNYQKIAAAAKGTSLEGTWLKEIYLGIVEASTALQLSQDETSGALYAVSQMISKGKVQAEELRGQLGERLPGAFQIAADAMGVTTAELNNMLDRGQIVADEFLPRFALALRQRFAGEVVAAANTTQSNLNRLKNTWFEIEKTIMESGITQELANVLKDVNTELKKWLEKNEDLIRQNIPVYIQETKDAIQGIVDIYNSLPDGIVGAAGTGIIARILTGSTPIGKFAFGLVFINALLKKLKMGLDFKSIVNETVGVLENFMNIWNAITGQPIGGGQAGPIRGKIPQRPETKIPGKAETGTALSPVGLLYQDIGKSLEAWREYYDAIAEYDARKKAEDEEIAEKRRQYLQELIRDQKAEAEEKKRYDEEEKRRMEELAEERKRLQENLFASEHQVMEALRQGWGLTWEEIRAGGVNAWEDIGRAMMNVTYQGSYALTDWVMGTKSAEEAAHDLAENILRQVVNTMIQIGMQRLILSQIQKTTTAEETGVTVAAMTAIKTAATPAAIQASIATSGAAAYTGMAAYTTAIFSMMALAESLGYFKAARGGIFTRPTFALFGEEGPEAVVPLSSGRRSEAYSVMTEAIKYMDGGSRRGGGYGGGEGRQPAQHYHITIQALDARSFVELTRDNPNAIVAPFRDQLRGGDKGLRDDIRRVAR